MMEARALVVLVDFRRDLYHVGVSRYGDVSASVQEKPLALRGIILGRAC